MYVSNKKKEPVQDLVIGDHKTCVLDVLVIAMPPPGPEGETGTIPLVLTSVIGMVNLFTWGLGLVEGDA